MLNNIIIFIFVIISKTTIIEITKVDKNYLLWNWIPYSVQQSMQLKHWIGCEIGQCNRRDPQRKQKRQHQKQSLFCLRKQSKNRQRNDVTIDKSAIFFKKISNKFDDSRCDDFNYDRNEKRRAKSFILSMNKAKSFIDHFKHHHHLHNHRRLHCDHCLSGNNPRSPLLRPPPTPSIINGERFRCQTLVLSKKLCLNIFLCGLLYFFNPIISSSEWIVFVFYFPFFSSPLRSSSSIEIAFFHQITNTSNCPFHFEE